MLTETKHTLAIIDHLETTETDPLGTVEAILAELETGRRDGLDALAADLKAAGQGVIAVHLIGWAGWTTLEAVQMHLVWLDRRHTRARTGQVARAVLSFRPHMPTDLGRKAARR